VPRGKTTKKAAPRKAFLPLGRRQHNVTQNPHNADRPTFVLRLEARPGISEIRALRWLLKVLARQHGFRCLDIREDDKGQRRR
jgi:hypothetical protein